MLDDDRILALTHSTPGNSLDVIVFAANISTVGPYVGALSRR